MIDLANLDTAKDDGVLLVLRHPGKGSFLTTDGKELAADKSNGVGIVLCSRDSQRYRDAVRAMTDKRMRDASPQSAAQIEESAVTLISACATDLRNVTLDGRPLDYSAANVKLLLSRFPWIREQADQFITDRANFLDG